MLYLWRQIEAQVACACQLVLDQKRHFLRKAEPDFTRQSAGLAEVDQVLEGECEGDWFGQVDGDIVVRLLDVGMLSDSDAATPDIALARESDAVL